MKSNICPVCEHVNHIENRYCTQCGSKLNKGYNFARLFMFYGQKGKNIFKLDKKKCTIGRNDTNTIFIDDIEISKLHATIFFKDKSYWIEDMQSKNGVQVNGKEITQPEQLHDGCLIKIGHTIFRFETPDKIG